MTKYVLLCFVGVCLVVLMLAGHAFSLDSGFLTNGTFAYIMGSLADVDLPEGSEDLSQEEYFEVLSNSLASMGIIEFLDADPNENVTYGEMANVLHSLLGGDEGLDTMGKISDLAKDGYMPLMRISSYVSIGDAVDILNNPDFSSIIAEAYSEPIEETQTVVGYADVIEEDPASEI